MNPTDPFLPMPETHHPAFTEGDAKAVRSMMGRGFSAVSYARPGAAAWVDESFGGAFTVASDRVVTMTVKKLAGPMPFVGDPRLETGWYTWKAAIDPQGRHIAGPAEIEWQRRY